MTDSDSYYVHGTSREEQQRLTRLNELLNATSLEALGLRAGDRVLDLGSGLGQFARDMARAVGTSGRVVGVERSQEQLAEARRQAAAAGEVGGVEFRQGDAMAPPLEEREWGAFDVVHTRFLLEHLPDPLAVVRAMVRAVRPGGRIVLEDDDHEVFRVWPEPEGLVEVWSAYCATYTARGNDPIIGRRLVELLHAAGAAPRRNRWLFFGACDGDPDFPDYVANLVTILEVARGDIIALGRFDSRRFDSAIEATRALSRHPGAAFWFARSWAEGVRPA
jgi:ubiquinone/menaquinone biosynthesis C-methylase UbiE